MQINKSTTLIKYLNQNSQSIASFSQIKTVYRLQNNTFQEFNALKFESGDGADFENFENGKSYLIFTESDANFTLETGSTSSLTGIQITATQQIDFFGDSSFPIVDLPNVYTVYKTSEGSGWNNGLQIWNRVQFEAGDGADFENFENGKVYIIFSTSVPYTLWPQEPIDPTVYVLKTENDDLIMTEDGYLLTTG